MTEPDRNRRAFFAPDLSRSLEQENEKLYEQLHNMYQFAKDGLYVHHRRRVWRRSYHARRALREIISEALR